MSRARWWLFYAAPAAGWAAGIFALSHISRMPRPPAYPGEDKVVHFLLYAILGLWILRAALARGRGHARSVAFVLAALYGLFDEFHQSFVPQRTPSGLDWVADILGAAVVFVTPRRGRMDHESRTGGAKNRGTAA